MRKYLLLLAALPIVLGSCRHFWGRRIHGNGNVKTEEHTVSPFSELHVSSTINVYVSQGELKPIKIVGDENLLSYIEIEQDGDELIIKNKNGVNLESDGDLKLYVTAPQFRKITVSGAGDIEGENKITSTDDMELGLSGAGSIRMEVDAPKVSSDISGVGSIYLKGQTKDADLTISGAGTKVSPRVSPRVKAHLSVIGAAIALCKAVGYLIAKWELVNSSNGYVQGATYTDIHARMPALTILFWLSLAAAVILLYNVRSRGWSLPVVAVGLWAFVALVIGVLYPTFLQALKVSPNQESLEQPYIQRDIDATRSAFGLDDVQYHSFAGAASITPSEISADMATLSNIRLWDPSNNISLQSVTRRQSVRSYYSFTNLSVDP